MKIVNRLCYKIAKELNHCGINCCPSIESRVAWLRENAPTAQFYFDGEVCLFFAQPFEERLARQYILLAKRHGFENVPLLVFSPVSWACTGPWRRAFVADCLPSAIMVNLLCASTALFEAAAHRMSVLMESGPKILLSDTEIHELAHKFTDYYAEAGFAGTDLCNLKCIMCFYHSDDVEQRFRFAQNRRQNVTKGIIADDLAFNFLDQVQDGKGVIFGGCGEFLTLKRWKDYFHYASTRNLRLAILTNGVLFDKEATDFCLSRGLYSITFSIDGHDKKSYEAIRIGSNFETVLRNLWYVYKQGKTRVQVNSVLLEEEKPYRDEIIRIFTASANTLNFSDVKLDIHSNTREGVKKFDQSDLCYQILAGLSLMASGRYAPCCGILNASFCMEFPWLADSRKYSLNEARAYYVEMLMDKQSPLSSFCTKCNWKWRSYTHNERSPFVESITLNQYIDK